MNMKKYVIIIITALTVVSLTVVSLTAGAQALAKLPAENDC